MRAVSTSPRPAVPDRDAAGNSLGRLLIGVAREMRTSFERRLAPLDITAQQAELIHRVHRHGHPSLNELTHLLMTDIAGVTRLVDRLEAKGLVRRVASVDDRRALRLLLTPRGRALVPRLARIAEEQKRQLVQGLTPAEEARLRGLLLRLLANARGSIQ